MCKLKTLAELSDEVIGLSIYGLEIVDGELNILLSNKCVLVICEDDDGDAALFYDRGAQA